MALELEIPATEPALYDLLQSKFGIGDFDEANPRSPWWQARNTEIAKLRGQMKRRRISIEEMTIAAWFAEREGRPITAVYQLCNIVGEARRAFRKAQAESDTGGLRERLSAAAAEAFSNGWEGWANRLYSADLSTGEQVLALYAEHKGRAR